MKGFAILLLYLTLVAHLTAQIPTSGLVAYYPFGGNADDQSGHTLNGVPFNLRLIIDRKFNPSSAYEFNGSDAYISLPNGVLNGMPQGTVSAWIDLYDHEYYTILDKTELGATNYFQWIVTDDGRLRLFLNTTYEHEIYHYSTTAIYPGRWHHVVATWDGMSASMFIDGNLDVTEPEANGIPDAACDIFLGKNGLGGHFNGGIDDIRIYNRALSPSEIQALFNENGWGTSNASNWVSGYFRNRVGADELEPIGIDYSTITHVMHFWLWPKADGTLDSIRGNVSVVNSAELVTTAHLKGRKVLISVGGAESGPNFVAAVTGHEEDFVQRLIAFAKNRGYDGIDIDWEDRTNLLAKNKDLFSTFVRKLRANLRTAIPSSILTAAANGGNALVYADLVDQFDQINLMTYDIMGTYRSRIWHDSPVYSRPIIGINDATRLSANDIVNEYVNARIPRAKLGIGIPFFGKVISGAMNLGDEWSAQDAAISVPTFTQLRADFQSQFSQGLVQWDEFAQAPYISVSDPLQSNQKFVTFNNEMSCISKVSYARANYLGGVFAFDLGEGYLPPVFAIRDPLVQSIKKGLENANATAAAKVVRWCAQSELISFDDPGAKTFVSFDIRSVSGKGPVTVARYSNKPENSSFAGSKPKYVSSYRWGVQQAGVSFVDMDIVFALPGFDAGIVNPTDVTVYSRPTEGFGAFSSLVTTYDPATQEIRAVASGMCEYVFGSETNTFTGVRPDFTGIKPSNFELAQNYPNPFNPSTTIRYGLPNRSHVTLTVFNTLGQQVVVLQNGVEGAGYHEVRFDGNALSSGVYFYRMQAGSYMETKRLTLLK